MQVSDVHAIHPVAKFCECMSKALELMGKQLSSQPGLQSHPWHVADGIYKNRTTLLGPFKARRWAPDLKHLVLALAFLVVDDVPDDAGRSVFCCVYLRVACVSECMYASQ